MTAVPAVPKKRRLASVELIDTFGVAHVTFPVKSIVMISADNGLGKSSIADGILNIFEGGKDEDIIRRGAKKSIVRLALEDGHKIEKITRYGSYEVNITGPNGLPVPQPQTFIKQLSEARAVSIGKLLRLDTTKAADRKTLMDEILRVMSITFEPQEVSEAARYSTATARVEGIREVTGDKWIQEEKPEVLYAADGQPMKLAALKKFIDQVRTLRGKTGASRDEAAAAVAQLGEAPVMESLGDVEGQLAKQQEELGRIEGALENDRLEIARASAEAIRDAEKVRDAAKDDIDRDIDAQIKALEEQRTRRKATAQDTFEKEKERIVKLAREDEEACVKAVQTRREDVSREVGRLQGLVEQRTTARVLLGQIDLLTAKKYEAAYKYDQLTAVIERLEALKVQKMASIPIPGLEFEEEDNVVTIDGVPWHKVNTARKIDAASVLCELAAGDLGFQIWDDAEHLSDNTRKVLEERMLAKGYQVIQLAVSNEDKLTITQVA